VYFRNVRASKLPNQGLSIFTVMSALAAKHNAINLSQGFPEFNPPEELVQKVNESLLNGKNQYSPMSVAQMAVSLFAANEGFLDTVEVNKVLDFEAALQLYMKSEHSELMNNINATGDFNNEISSGLKAAIESFIKTHSW